MLDIHAIEAISLHVDSTIKDKRLTPIPGSTLSQLTTGLIDKSKFALSSVDNADVRDNFTTDDVIKLVNAASYEDPENCNLHHDLMTKASKDIARIMSNNNLLARTVVLPLVDEYTERLTSHVSEKCNRGNLALNIIEDRSRIILASPQLKSIVSDQTKRTNYEEIELPRYHKTGVTIPELRAMIATGQRGFDEIIEKWIDVNDLELSLKIVYDDVFAASRVSAHLFSKYINTTDYQRSIIALLLCWGLVKNPQEDISKSLKDYKQTMEIFSAACCGMIAQAIARYERGIKNKNLVLSYPTNDRQFCFDEPEKNCILVNSETYKEFIELGGRPEMIFGSYLTNDRVVNAQGILVDGEKYIKEYARQLARGKLASINNVLNIVRKELRNITFDIIKSFNETNDSVETVRDCEVSFTGSQHLILANQFIENICVRDIEDYYRLMRDFICKCFFEGSMVYQLLVKIDALDPDGKQDINDIAIVATTDLIVDWLLTQLEHDTSSVSLEGFYTK